MSTPIIPQPELRQHGCDMKWRIRKRRFAFVGWVFSLGIFSLAIGTYFFPFAYCRAPNCRVFFQDSKVAAMTLLGSAFFVSDDIDQWLVMGTRSDQTFGDALNSFLSMPKRISSLKWTEDSFPLGWPSLLALVLTSILFWRPMHVTKSGHCKECGYDLTSNQSGVCPECGTKISVNQPVSVESGMTETSTTN